MLKDLHKRVLLLVIRVLPLKIWEHARIDLEKFFNKKVFLDLHVKVNKNWRSDENKLKKFGYQNN